MKRNPTRFDPGPAPSYSLGETLLGTAVLAAVLATVLLAVSYPVVAGAVAALALVGRPLGRDLRARWSARRREGRSRTVCLPGLDVCMEA